MILQATKLFTKTSKELPADEQSKNAKLLIKAGFVHKSMAGIYSLLPLGLRVVEKISSIIEEEMNKVGGVKMRAATLQSKEAWEASGRWGDDFDDGVWFKTKLNSGTELGLAFTHEEAMVSIMKNFIRSYKDLPAYPYDIRTIFRNELRAKSGLLRGREFLWKAMYSFSKSKEEHDEFYEKVAQAYRNVYDRVGIGHKTHFTFALGGTFSKYSHEFQTETEAGEDTVYINRESGMAINEEAFADEILKDLGIDSKEGFEPVKMIEVGNIFSLAYKFSEPLGLLYEDENGDKKPVYMGSYGIGITRLLGTIVEVLADEKGLNWPKSITPLHVHIVSLGENDKTLSLAKTLNDAGFDVYVDDRDKGAGEKFKDADLLGIPFRVTVSKKAEENGGYELKFRDSDELAYLTESELVGILKKEYEKD